MAPIADEKEQLFHPKETNRTRSWSGVALGVLGIMFTLTDIVSDALLAYEYKQDALFYTTFLNNTALIRVKWENGSLWQSDHYKQFWTRQQHWKNITEECADQYLCTEKPKTSIDPTDYCANRIRKVVAMDPPKHQLESAILAISSNYMWSCLTFIISGGLVQTLIAIALAFQKDEDFTSLPMFVRVSTIISSPLLLGPVVVTLYLIVRCSTGINEKESEQYKVLIGTLKMGEIIIETIPQLIMNAISFTHRCTVNRPSEHFAYSAVTTVKWFSICTGILGLAYAIADWIKKKDSSLFVSRSHHPLSSFLGLFLCCITVILAIFTGVINAVIAEGMLRDPEKLYWPKPGTFWRRFHPIPGIIGGTVTTTAFPILPIIFLLLVICSSCTSSRCCKRFKLCVSILYIIVFAAQMGILTHVQLLSGYEPMILTLGFGYTHLLLAILVFISPSIGAGIFDPLVRLILSVVGKINCSTSKEKKKNNANLECKESDISKEDTNALVAGVNNVDGIEITLMGKDKPENI